MESSVTRVAFAKFLDELSAVIGPDDEFIFAPDKTQVQNSMKLKNIYSSSQWRNQPSRTGGKEGGMRVLGHKKNPTSKIRGGNCPPLPP